MVGREASVADLVAEIERDIPFFEESGGGVTFSGGEPLMQPRFLEALLRACREREVHTTVDTSGYASWQSLERAAAITDLFLYDVKLIDPAQHRRFTGVSNELILSNLRKLACAEQRSSCACRLSPALRTRTRTWMGSLPWQGRFPACAGSTSCPTTGLRSANTPAWRWITTWQMSARLRQERMAEIARRLAGRSFQTRPLAGQNWRVKDGNERTGEAVAGAKPGDDPHLIGRTGGTADRVLPRQPRAGIRRRCCGPNPSHYLLEHKTICINPGELIVGEKGPTPQAAPTFPELCCHSLQDLEILDSRPRIPFAVSPEVRKVYQEEIIPFWQGRTMRERIFQEMAPEWIDAYQAGIFTEFMEQRSPGHTVLDDKIYRKGMLDFSADIQRALDGLDFLNDPQAYHRQEELKAMLICADAIIHFAGRYAEQAEALAAAEPDPARRNELLQIAAVCRWVPAHAPAHLLGGAAGLLVHPSGRHHRAEHLGLVRPGAAGPAPGPLLPARAGRRDPYPPGRPKSCCSASGSSSTTSLPRPKWA